jgi:thiol-disulfide isomerase/thioredoxin
MLLRLLAIGALLAITSLAYAWWSRQQGRVRRVVAAGALTRADLGVPPGARGTVVVFSTPLCAKCPGTKAMLSRLLEDFEGVAQAEIDAAERLDIARRFDIMRTPTVLVLNANGVAVARMDGAPTPVQAREAIDALPPLSGYSI